MEIRLSLKTVYCGIFIGSKMVARACVEKYSEDFWEIADVRTAKGFRNHGYAYQLCLFILAYVLSQNKTATIRTEENNDTMQKVICKLGFKKL